MKNHGGYFVVWLRSGLLYFTCSLILAAGATVAGLKTRVKPRESGSAQMPPVIVRPGLKLEIVEMKQRSDHGIEVIIRNGYDKDVTAVAASADTDTLHQAFNVDLIYAEIESAQRLAPGAVYDSSCSPSRVSGIVPQVVISGVVLSDGKVKGDKRDLQEILDNRHGMKTQLDRINPHLERLGNVKGPRIRTELLNTIRIAESLEITNGKGAGLSPAFEYGLRTGREFILRYLSRMDLMLDSEYTETFYQNGAPQTVQRGGEDELRSYLLPRIQKDFKSLAARL